MIGIANYGDIYYPISVAVKRSDGTAVDPSEIGLYLYYVSQIDGSMTQVLEIEPTKQFGLIGFYYHPVYLVGMSLGHYVARIEAVVLGRETHWSDNFLYENKPKDLWDYDPSNSPQKSSGGYLDNLNKVQG